MEVGQLSPLGLISLILLGVLQRSCSLYTYILFRKLIQLSLWKLGLGSLEKTAAVILNDEMTDEIYQNLVLSLKLVKATFLLIILLRQTKQFLQNVMIQSKAECTVKISKIGPQGSFSVSTISINMEVFTSFEQ